MRKVWVAGVLGVLGCLVAGCGVSKEVVTLFRLRGGEHFLVLGHNINCKGLVL